MKTAHPLDARHRIVVAEESAPGWLVFVRNRRGNLLASDPACKCASQIDRIPAFVVLRLDGIRNVTKQDSLSKAVGPVSVRILASIVCDRYGCRTINRSRIAGKRSRSRNRKNVPDVC